LLVDISSVKAPVIDFLRSQGRPVLSIHPFFGPGAESLKGMNVAVIYPPRPSGRSREIIRCLRVAGARIVRCTPEIHDLAVSYTLALPHLLGAIYGSMLRNSGLGPRSLADFGGTSFRAMYSLARSIGSESPLVYASIQLAHPSYPRTLRRALLLLRKVQEELSAGERRTFMRLVGDCSSLPPLGGIEPVGSGIRGLSQRKSFKV
jgi:prephenate dehydrogenase